MIFVFSRTIVFLPNKKGTLIRKLKKAKGNTPSSIPQKYEKKFYSTTN
jgi:hypothetical protein